MRSQHDPERDTYESDLWCDECGGDYADVPHPNPRSDEWVCRGCEQELNEE